MEANPMVAAMMRKMMGVERPALDILPVPREHLREFYERFGAYDDNESPMRLKHEFWKWLGTIMPAVRGKMCRTNIDITLRPVIEITGDSKAPVVGEKYSHVYKMTDEQVEKYLEFDEELHKPGNRALRLLDLALWVQSIWPEVVEFQYNFEGSGNCGLYLVVAKSEGV